MDREDIMMQFAVEESHGADVVAYYCKKYPQWAAEFIQTAWYFDQPEPDTEDIELTPEDHALIERLWQGLLESIQNDFTS